MQVPSLESEKKLHPCLSRPINHEQMFPPKKIPTDELVKRIYSLPDSTLELLNMITV